ncbi:hypothetical protein T01_3841 [Trichinella spiralis]|uniref:Uncharacterized protein n=1 Tax=Trichinella spiralis TaxID=6334 RepID=A0A0V1B1Q9_TRISP|nr:hypothetical protein T01_3841 [Trichinella spiralis]
MLHSVVLENYRIGIVTKLKASKEEASPTQSRKGRSVKHVIRHHHHHQDQEKRKLRRRLFKDIWFSVSVKKLKNLTNEIDGKKSCLNANCGIVDSEIVLPMLSQALMSNEFNHTQYARNNNKPMK